MKKKKEECAYIELKFVKSCNECIEYDLCNSPNRTPLKDLLKGESV